MEQLYAGDDWIDDDCVSYNRERKVSREGERRKLCGSCTY